MTSETDASYRRAAFGGFEPGMILTGTVRNVADFGAFVDVGVHQDGLVHISELSDKYVKVPWMWCRWGYSEGQNFGC